MGAIKGNRNAVKSAKQRSETIYTDVNHRNAVISTLKEREAWNKQAANSGLSFSKWARQKLCL